MLNDFKELSEFTSFKVAFVRTLLYNYENAVQTTNVVELKSNLITLNKSMNTFITKLNKEYPDEHIEINALKNFVKTRHPKIYLKVWGS